MRAIVAEELDALDSPLSPGERSELERQIADDTAPNGTCSRGSS